MRMSRRFAAVAAITLFGMFGCSREAKNASSVNPPANSASTSNSPTNNGSSANVIQIRGDTTNLPSRFELLSVRTLDSSSVDIDNAFAIVVRNSRGEYIVQARENTLVLLDSSGKPIRKFGRSGKGPGEFVRLYPLVVAAFDTVYAFDGAQRRWTVVDPNLSRLVRTVPVSFVSGSPSIMTLPQSQIIIGGEVFNGPAPDTSANTLRVVSADGRVLRSWNSDTMTANLEQYNRSKGIREPRAGRTGVMSRFLARGPNGELIVARANSYTVEQWTNDFQLTRTFERRVEWFPTLLKASMMKNIFVDSMPAQIYGVTVDSAARNIVVEIMTAARNWKAPPDVIATAEGKSLATKPNPGDLTQFLDTIFEAFDPATGELTASSRFPGYFAPTGRDGEFWTRRELPSGDVVLDVVKLALVPNPKHRN